MPKKKMETPEVIEAVFPEETAEPAAEQSEASGELEAADETVMDAGSEEHAPLPEIPPPKPKRTRKKKADTVDGEDISEVPPSSAETDSTPKETTDKERPNKPKADPILTIEAGAEVTTDEHLADIAWHEIHNVYRTRRILTGFLGGLERNDAGKTVAVVEYKGYRVLILFKEMAVGILNQLTGKDYNDMVIRYRKRMQVVKGKGDMIVLLDESGSTRSVAAWAKAFALAMLDIASKDKRKFALIHFASSDDVKVDLFELGYYRSENMIAAAKHFFGGGTDFEAPLREALNLLERGC